MNEKFSKKTLAVAALLLLTAIGYFALQRSLPKQHGDSARAASVAATATAASSDSTVVKNGEQHAPDAPLSSQRAATSDSIKGPDLDAESRLLADGMVATERAENLLRSKRFDAYLTAFSNEAARDPDAAQMTSLYTRQVADQMGRNSIGANLDRLVCGARLCIGRMTGAGLADYRRWEHAFEQDRSVAHYAFFPLPVDVGNQSVEYRFLFTIDPASNGFSVGP